MKAKLDSLERQIEKHAETFRPIAATKRRTIEKIIARARKRRTVNIRIAEKTLEELKQRSEQEGIPYQTLISSILHKYVTDRLVDEESIRKSIKLLHLKQGSTVQLGRRT